MKCPKGSRKNKAGECVKNGFREKRKRCPNGTRKTKTGDCTPKDEIFRKRCPNGTRKNREGECIEKGDIVRKRCPNGSRKNKAGDCVAKDAADKARAAREAAEKAKAEKEASDKARADKEAIAQAKAARAALDKIKADREARAAKEAAEKAAKSRKSRGSKSSGSPPYAPYFNYYDMILQTPKKSLVKPEGYVNLRAKLKPKNDATMDLIKEKIRIKNPVDVEYLYVAIVGNKELGKNLDFLHYAICDLTPESMRLALKHYAPQEVPNFDQSYLDWVKKKSQTAKFAQNKQSFIDAPRQLAAYSENLRSPIITINSHGGYDVGDDMLPLRTFNAPIKVFLYRSAQPSCVNYQGIIRASLTYNLLKVVYEDFKSYEILGILNREMCDINLNKPKPNDKNYDVLYQKFCFGNVNVIKYDVGDRIANKVFTLNKIEKNHGGIRVVCDHDYFSEQNLLLDINEGKNRYTMQQIVEAAERNGAKECHLIDFGCSVFYNGKNEVLGDEAHINLWKKHKYGGRK